MSAPLYVPGRPVTGPGGKCPFCLDNNMFQGTIIAENEHGFAGQISDDLVLICPKEHLIDEPWESAFATVYFDLLRQAIKRLGWESYNDSRNKGHVAGQRLLHLHYKVMRRDTGKASSGWGLDALTKIIDGEM